MRKSFCWLSAIIHRTGLCTYSGRMETPKPERTPQAADKYVLRLPDGMRDKLAELAKSNNRSMNAEIVQILHLALDGRHAGAGCGADVAALADAIAERVALKLKNVE